MEIKRDHYLKQIITHKHNGLIKIINGIRRCGNQISWICQRISKC